MAGEGPSVGRIVHYRDFGDGGPVCRAAIVTEVTDGGPGIGVEGICLCVMQVGGIVFEFGVRYDEDQSHTGTWHWPERTQADGVVRTHADGAV